MAKVAFTKLGLKINKEIVTISYNDQEIEIRQYIPVNEKLDIISNIINASADDMKFYNVGKIEVFSAIEIISAYTNIGFTEKQREDICKLYDMCVSSGLYGLILDAIPESEITWIEEVMMNTIDSIYKYQNSAMGILDSVNQDYQNLNLDATEIQQKLGDPENMALLKSIMTKLG